MAKGRGEFEWGMTSVLLATYMNANRKKGSRAVKPEDLNPFLDAHDGRGERIQLNQRESIAVLRKVFINGTR